MISKNYLVLIIQARMNSKRFPNKVISDLSGTPLIERILQRVKKVKKIEKIIIATTKRKEDDILVEIAKSNKVEAFRGSENDLVDRYYQAVKDKNFSHILRVPADNPIPDPSEYNRLINYHLKTDNDFSSNICNFMRNGYPDGFGVEIFTVNSLKKIWKNEKRKKFREHIALNFYDYKKDKKI
jgi:spore coat polysaccharide biosynthesis protein SpsF (cytidylyltransferase family)